MVNLANISHAYSEVYSFINLLGEEYKNKIPVQIYKTIEENRDFNFNPRYDINMEVKDNTFSKEALALIASLNLKYWCDNPEEKEKLKSQYIRNTQKEEEKYSYDNLFKKSNIYQREVLEQQELLKQQEDNHMQMIVYNDENILKRIINQIKQLLNKLKRK